MTLDIVKEPDCSTRLVDADIQSVNRLIDQNLVSLLPSPNKLIRYFRAHCGKMIRPKLLLLSGGACGRIGKDHILSAAVFQIIHDATLLHDDVIDEGLLRRNAATINSKWGNKVAVLTGDLLLGHAMKMSLSLNSRSRSIIMDTIIKTCEGEICQDFNELYDNISEQEYITLIQMKSAEMFGQCCYLGGLMSGANEDICLHLKTYGLLAGTAYQISDDIEDICSDDSQSGKSSSRDMKSKVITLPVICYIQQGGNWEQLNKMPREQMIDELTKKGCIQYCQKKIELFCNEAIEHLTLLEDSTYKYLLKNAVESISTKSKITRSSFM
jgi:octaprenyl-diphosphate synthase